MYVCVYTQTFASVSGACAGDGAISDYIYARVYATHHTQAAKQQMIATAKAACAGVAAAGGD